MRVEVALVNFQFPVNGATQFVMRNHPADGAFDEQFRMALPASLGVLGLMTANVPGKAHESFLVFLLAGEPDLFGVDHDNEIACIHVGSEDGFFFAAKK